MLQTALRNIEGEITINEARELVKEYYVKRTAHDAGDEDGNVVPDVVAQFIEHVMAWKGSEKEK